MSNFCNSFTLLFIFVLFTNIATAEEPETCKLLKKEKGSVAYLLDEHGKVSKGPIDFGRYDYTYHNARNLYYIPTKFRIVISPARLHLPYPCTLGDCLEFTKVVSVCPNSNTYLISYTGREWPQNATDRSWLPRKVNDSVYAGIFEDPEMDIGEPDVKFRFDLRIVGEIYDATKK